MPAVDLSGFSVPTASLTTFLLVLCRTSAWSVTSPLTGTRSLPGFTRLALAVPLAVFITPLTGGTAPDQLDSFIATAVVQTLVGLALGFLTSLLLMVIEVAGGLSDLLSGFAYGAMLDPVTGNNSALFARLGNFFALVLLFVTDAGATIITGFVRSFDALPIGRTPSLSPDTAAMLGHTVGQLLIAAVEIAAPLLGVMFLADIGLALASRIVPHANVLSASLSIKAYLALGTFATVLTLAPSRLASLVSPALHTGGAILR